MGLGSQFHELFLGLERAHGSYIVGKKSSSGKVDGKARTLQEPVTDDLWVEHLKGDKGLGVIPIDDNDECHWAALDIDIYEGFDHNKMEETIRRLKLPLIPCTTKSGGLHLYLFMNEPCKAKLIRSKMAEWATILGHGNAEIFPKQSELKDNTGNWINMPYFNANQTTRYAIRNGKPIKAADFLEYANKYSMSVTELKKIKVQIDEDVAGAPPCIRTLWVAGVPDGVRDKGCFSVGVFLKKKFEDDWQDRLYDFNEERIKPKLPNSAVAKCITSLEKKEYMYQCGEQPLLKLCNKDLCAKCEYGIGSEGPGVELTHLRRMLTPAGEVIKWIIAIDGRDLELEDTNDLLMQDRFIKICFEVLLILPNRCKTGVWMDAIRQLPVEDIPAPEDASVEGQFIVQFEQFVGKGLGRSMDDLLQGLAFVLDEDVLFQGRNLIDFLKGQKFQITAPQVWSILQKRLSASKRSKRIKGRVTRLWAVPLDNINRQTEEFDVPDVAGGM
jgi:hypothetical protein